MKINSDEILILYDLSLSMSDLDNHDAGTVDYITKPFKIEDIRNCLKKYLKD